MPKKKSQTAKLKDYITKEQSKGFNLAIIKKKLGEAGYHEEEINAVIAKYHLEGDTTQRTPTEHMQAMETNINKNRFIKITFSTILIIGLLYFAFTLLQGPNDCGDDMQCFIDHANTCTPALLSQTVDGTIFSYDATATSTINADCSLTKAITELDEREPKEIKEIFEGKSMNCPYTKGNFNTELVYTITGGLEPCEGELKTAIYEMILAIYELREEGEI